MKTHFTKTQLDATSKYLADISKLVFAGAVLGFFIPIGPQPVTITTFAIGIVIMVATFLFSIQLTK